MTLTNVDLWNELAEVHYFSDFYSLSDIVAGGSSLLQVEIDLMKQFSFGRVLHTHCHIGTDSISLSRVCDSVTGVDFAEAAITIATGAAAMAYRTNCDFVCDDSHSLAKVPSDEPYDTVFASYGVLVWISDLERWFNAHRAHLRSGGQLIIIDEHPIAATYDRARSKDSLYPDLDFSGHGNPYYTINPRSYSGDTKVLLNQKQTKWQHSMSDIINSASSSGLRLLRLDEFAKCHYPILDNMIKCEDGYFRHEIFNNKVPLLFSVVFEAC